MSSFLAAPPAVASSAAMTKTTATKQQTTASRTAAKQAPATTTTPKTAQTKTKTKAPTTKAHKAAEAWRMLFGVFLSTRHERDAVLARLGLTPTDARALATIDDTDGQPMSVLAGAWGTDASNVTWVVDRLEQRGLAERRADPADRRVKRVVLTARGARVRDQIDEAFHRPPASLAALSHDELDALIAVLGRVA